MKSQTSHHNAGAHVDSVPAGKTSVPAAPTAMELYQVTRTLFRAFHYLKPRMRGGDLAPPTPMNAEALAGCILHACMSRLVREIKQVGGAQEGWAL